MRDESEQKFMQFIQKLIEENAADWGDFILDIERMDMAFDIITQPKVICAAAKLKHLYWFRTMLEKDDTPVKLLIQSLQTEALYRLEKGFLGIGNYEMYHRAGLILYYDFKVEWHRICEEFKKEK
jgi:hypothetical protein